MNGHTPPYYAPSQGQTPMFYMSPNTNHGTTRYSHPNKTPPHTYTTASAAHNGITDDVLTYMKGIVAEQREQKQIMVEMLDQMHQMTQFMSHFVSSKSQPNSSPTKNVYYTPEEYQKSEHGEQHKEQVSQPSRVSQSHEYDKQNNFQSPASISDTAVNGDVQSTEPQSETCSVRDYQTYNSEKQSKYSPEPIPSSKSPERTSFEKQEEHFNIMNNSNNKNNNYNNDYVHQDSITNTNRNNDNFNNTCYENNNNNYNIYNDMLDKNSSFKINQSNEEIQTQDQVTTEPPPTHSPLTKPKKKHVKKSLDFSPEQISTRNSSNQSKNYYSKSYSPRSKKSPQLNAKKEVNHDSNLPHESKRISSNNHQNKEEIDSFSYNKHDSKYHKHFSPNKLSKKVSRSPNYSKHLRFGSKSSPAAPSHTSTEELSNAAIEDGEFTSVSEDGFCFSDDFSMSCRDYMKKYGLYDTPSSRSRTLDGSTLSTKSPLKFSGGKLVELYDSDSSDDEQYRYGLHPGDKTIDYKRSSRRSRGSNDSILKNVNPRHIRKIT